MSRWKNFWDSFRQFILLLPIDPWKVNDVVANAQNVLWCRWKCSNWWYILSICCWVVWRFDLNVPIAVFSFSLIPIVCSSRLRSLRFVTNERASMIVFLFQIVWQYFSNREKGGSNHYVFFARGRSSGCCHAYASPSPHMFAPSHLIDLLSLRIHEQVRGESFNIMLMAK